MFEDMDHMIFGIYFFMANYRSSLISLFQTADFVQRYGDIEMTKSKAPDHLQPSKMTKSKPPYHLRPTKMTKSQTPNNL